MCSYGNLTSIRFFLDLRLWKVVKNRNVSVSNFPVTNLKREPLRERLWNCVCWTCWHKYKQVFGSINHLKSASWAHIFLALPGAAWSPLSARSLDTQHFLSITIERECTKGVFRDLHFCQNSSLNSRVFSVLRFTRSQSSQSILRFTSKWDMSPASYCIIYLNIMQWMPFVCFVLHFHPKIGCLVIPKTTGNDMKNDRKRSEMTGNDMRQDFC